MTPEQALDRILSAKNSVVVDLTALDILVREYEDLKFRMDGLEK